MVVSPMREDGGRRMSAPKILIARSAAALAPCRLCRKPNPPEDLSPRAVCKSCWVTEGAPGGWVLIPPGMALVPTPVIQQANLGAALASEILPHCGERGVEEPVLLTLRRLLAELRATRSIERGEVFCEGCCYCGEEPSEEKDTHTVCSEFLIMCTDRAACVQRVEAQIRARLEQPKAGSIN